MKLGKQTQLLLGPPGTGKTQRCLKEVTDRDPDSLSFVTFTRRAAEEARTRTRTRRAPGEFRTLHSLAFQQLGVHRGMMLDWPDYKEIGDALGIRFSRYFDAEEAMGANAMGDRLRAVVDYAAAACVEPSEVPNDLDPWQLRRYVETLAAYKRDTGKLDFNDLLARVPQECEPLRVALAVIDEAQDLSRLQWLAAAFLFKHVPTVIVAGDDDQAIFRWAGADVDTFLHLDATREVLRQSWRCPLYVAEQALTISRRIKERYEKQWQPRAGLEGAVRRVGSPFDVDLKVPGTHLLLARNGFLLQQWVDVCRAAGVPYLRRDKPGIDPAHVRAIRAWERWRKGKAPTDAERRDIDLLVASDSWAGQPKHPWYEDLTRLDPEDAAFYRQVLARGGDLEQKPRVQITTVHGAKGGEADHVAVLADRSAKTDAGAVERPDDEHRVAYVAVTRARETLTLVQPQSPWAYSY